MQLFVNKHDSERVGKTGKANKLHRSRCLNAGFGCFLGVLCAFVVHRHSAAVGELQMAELKRGVRANAGFRAYCRTAHNYPPGFWTAGLIWAKVLARLVVRTGAQWERGRAESR